MGTQVVRVMRVGSQSAAAWFHFGTREGATSHDAIPGVICHLIENAWLVNRPRFGTDRAFDIGVRASDYRSGMRHESFAKCGYRRATGYRNQARARKWGRLEPDTKHCGELLHGLNNALSSVLLNAQVMAWKLPSYSRGKRYLHEIERNAQRAGELVKRLLERSQADCHIGQCPRHSGTEAAAVGFDGVAPARERTVSTQPVEQRPTP